MFATKIVILFMPPFIYPLISATCFGISNAYWRKIEKAGFSYEEAIFYRGFIGIILLSALWLYLRYTNQLANLVYVSNQITVGNHWLQTLLVCLICSLGLVCFVPSLRYCIVAVAVSLSSINVFGILTAIAFFGEAFLFKHFISLLIGAIGILLIALKGDRSSGRVGLRFRSIILPLLAAFFWGVGYTLFKIPLQWMGALSLGVIIELVVWLVSIVLLLKNGSIPFKRLKEVLTVTPHFYVAGALLVGGSLFINIAITHLKIVEVNILGMVCFPVTILAAFMFYKEKPTLKEWMGMLLIVTSVIYSILAN